MTTKKKWLEAYKQVRDEYKNNTHDADNDKCVKCNLGEFDYNTYSCIKCPESAFDISFGCLYRFTKASNSRGLSKEKRNVIVEYHNKAIEWLETTKSYSFKKFQAELLRIDNEIREREED